MPCQSSEGMTSGPSYEDVKRLKDELDNVTAILCAVLNFVPDNLLDPRTRDWKHRHQAFDKSQGRR